MRVSLVLGLTVALPAFAEVALVNVHVDPFAGSTVDRPAYVSGVVIKLDTTVLRVLGPISPQVEVFGGGGSTIGVLDQGAVFGGGLGARLRLWNDEEGFLFNPGQKRRGTLWGNAWADAHVTVSSGRAPVGFDVAAGVELSLLEGLSLGPFVRFQLVQATGIIAGGITFAIGAPQTTPARADFDHDGVPGPADRCPDEAEDADGFEDDDGCPDTDDDRDGVADEADACPRTPEDVDGVADEDGCPETDADGDGSADGVDGCPVEPGPDRGCPDSDVDGDGAVDRVDLCPSRPGVSGAVGCPDADGDTLDDALDVCAMAAGPPWNAGCPVSDGDQDGVVDPLDSCVTLKGAADTGCPAGAVVPVRLGLAAWSVDGGVEALAGPQGGALLKALAAQLVAHPEVTQLIVRAPAALATAVVDGLVALRIDRTRLAIAEPSVQPALVPVRARR